MERPPGASDCVMLGSKKHDNIPCGERGAPCDPGAMTRKSIE